MKSILIIAFLELGLAKSENKELNRKERGSSGSYSGPLSVWYGESGIASVSSRNGIWDRNMKVENMFDENAGTSWHSERRFERVAKTMRVDFFVSTMYFYIKFY